MNKKFVIMFIVTVFILGVLSGCSPANTDHSSSVSNSALSGDAHTILAKAAYNLQQSTNFEATKTLTVKINGKETSTTVYQFITNTSSIYFVSGVEMRNGNQKEIFKRLHLKNVQYEYAPNSSEFKLISKDKNPQNFTYSYYRLNRSLVMDLMNTIYSPGSKKFGDFVSNLKKDGKQQLLGFDTTVLVYSYKGEDPKRIIERNGKIYIAIVNGKLYPIEVYDDRVVTFKSNKTKVENITQLVIKNIGHAKNLTESQ